jgi:hypothetical protein
VDADHALVLLDLDRLRAYNLADEFAVIVSYGETA